MRRSTNILLPLILLFLFSCGAKKDEKAVNSDLSENILGNWTAKWEMTGDEVKDYKPRQRIMNGKMKFEANGEVKVSTYGFDGCIFMPDTSTNTMNWKLENQVLRFMDKKDVHGIPYNIESFTNDEVKLSIMENIHLTLKR